MPTAPAAILAEVIILSATLSAFAARIENAVLVMRYRGTISVPVPTVIPKYLSPVVVNSVPGNGATLPNNTLKMPTVIVTPVWVSVHNAVPAVATL